MGLSVTKLAAIFSEIFLDVNKSEINNSITVGEQTYKFHDYLRLCHSSNPQTTCPSLSSRMSILPKTERLENAPPLLTLCAGQFAQPHVLHRIHELHIYSAKHIEGLTESGE